MDLSNENMVQVEKNGVGYLQFRKLLEANVINCYTTRLNNFDLSFQVEKQKQEEEYQVLSQALEIERNSIVRPFQSHTDEIRRVDKIGEIYQDVDGVVTNQPGIHLMLTFADCTPIFLYDPVNHAIGNIHSGWKGTLQKIGQKAVKRMQKEYGTLPEDLLVFLGPCIKECHFEVEKDVKELFEKEFSYLGKNEEIIFQEHEIIGKYRINTTRINQLILEEVGVLSKNIIDSQICTVCHSDILHSYRKDGEKSGRNVAVLGLKS